MDKNLKILENLSLERLEESFKSISGSPNKEDEQGKKRLESYKNAYPFFVQYFAGIEEITIDNLVIAAHFVYGWMPTILTFEFAHIDKVLEALNKVKRGNLLNSSEIVEIKACVNNSLVGTSKLLHFIKPDKYAIWDSNIYAYLKETKKHYGVDNVDLYLGYLKKLGEITNEDKFKDFHNAINSKIKYNVTPMRAIEYVMFHAHPKSESTE